MATKTELILFYVCVVASIIPSVSPVEYCTTDSYCEDGYYCCENDTQCCREDVLAVGAIIGIVIGIIIFISCVTTCICCVVKQSNHTTHVIQPFQQPAGVVVVAR